MDANTNTTMTERLDTLAAEWLKQLVQLSREEMSTEERIRIIRMQSLLWGSTPFEIEELIQRIGRAPAEMIAQHAYALSAYEKLASAPKRPEPIADDRVCSDCAKVFFPAQLDDDSLCEPCAKAEAAMFAEAGIPWTPAPRGVIES